MSTQKANESTEPLAGRLGVGADAPTHSEDISYKPLAAKSSCACEWGGWGRLSEDGPGHYNPDRSEGPWGRADEPLERRCPSTLCPSAQYEDFDQQAMGTKDGCKPYSAKNLALAWEDAVLTDRP